MDNVIDALLGLDTRKEIFNLWYEIHFVRHIMAGIVSQNPEFTKILDEEFFELARQRAAQDVQKRFPNYGINFKSPSEGQQADPSCTSQDLSESPPASPDPSNEG